MTTYGCGICGKDMDEERGMQVCAECRVGDVAVNDALITAYVALGTYIPDANDPDLCRGERNPIEAIEAALPIPLLVTILPAYTKVAYTLLGLSRTGIIRDIPHGLFKDRRDRGVHFPRRITTSAGLELMVQPSTPFESFEIIERP